MRRGIRQVLLGCAVASAALARAEPQQQEFGWAAPVTTPSSAGVQRLRVPDDGVAALRGSIAEDLRIVNGSGQAVPYARLPLLTPEAAPAADVATAAFTVHALRAAPGAGVRPGGRVQVVIDGRRVAVDLGEASASPTSAGVLVDTRRQREPLDGLDLDGDLPANRPVTFDVSVSSDLQHWQRVPGAATLYRFEGADAPAQRRIRFAQPLDLRDRMLRLVPREADGVTVTGVRGWRQTRAAAEPDRVRIALGPASTVAAESAEWVVPMALAIVGIEIQSMQDNSLLPVRVLGRPPGGGPWRPVAATVVYRLSDGAGGAQTNPVQALVPTPLAQLRLERAATVGSLADAQLRVVLHVAPVELAFVVSGPPPYALVTGRPSTPDAALPLATLIPGWQPGDERRLPLATVGAGQRRTPAAPGGLAGLAHVAGEPASRETLLWAVLLGGVFVLGVIAAVLLRQLRRGS